MYQSLTWPKDGSDIEKLQDPVKRHNTKVMCNEQASPVQYLPRLSGCLNCDSQNLNTPINIESLKRKIKTIMLEVQAFGENAKWPSENFVLNCIPGLRSSSRVNSQ